MDHAARAGHAGCMPPADVALIIALDASASVDRGEFDLMTRGLGWALRQDEVVAAFTAGPARASLVALLLWSGTQTHDVALGWTRIAHAAAARHFAESVENVPRAIPAGGTALGDALAAAEMLFAALPATPARRVLDIAGDGRANEGRPPAPVRDRLVAAGVTINGLCVLNEEPDLLAYYQAQIIGGPAAFAVACRDYEDFARAMRGKLAREIA